MRQSAPADTTEGYECVNPLIWTEKNDLGKQTPRMRQQNRGELGITPRPTEQQAVTEAELIKDVELNSLQVISLESY